MSEKVVRLDVREDIRQGREPFGKIMTAVSRLKKNQKLLLIAPFQPVPLFGVLAQQGFSHDARSTTEGDWEVLFSRSSEAELPSGKTPASSQSPAKENCPCGCGREVIDVDARGLEPPQPLVKILEALTGLPKHKELRARTDRRPIHLYAHLDDRGYVGRTEEQEDGSFATYIHRVESA